MITTGGWTTASTSLSRAYTELTRLLRLTGGSPKLLAHLPLTLRAPGRLHLKGRRAARAFPPGRGSAASESLTWADRMAMVRLMRRLKSDFRVPPEMTVTGLMRETRQTAAMIELSYVGAAMRRGAQHPAGEASAQIFANVLRDSLAGSASASELLIRASTCPSCFLYRPHAISPPAAASCAPAMPSTQSARSPAASPRGRPRQPALAACRGRDRALPCGYAARLHRPVRPAGGTHRRAARTNRSSVHLALGKGSDCPNR
ncbi:hypothetical protein [Thauera humireducens]|uniref:hypothetical protein n=1 Tax=Thauera humireducens TaxID=1134435 RepID=UPI0031202C87